jgi:hypothetical protein
MSDSPTSEEPAADLEVVTPALLCGLSETLNSPRLQVSLTRGAILPMEASMFHGFQRGVGHWLRADPQTEEFILGLSPLPLHDLGCCSWGSKGRKRSKLHVHQEATVSRDRKL